jgi:hypothetical protein
MNAHIENSRHKIYKILIAQTMLKTNGILNGWYDAYLSSAASNSRGVAILFKN